MNLDRESGNIFCSTWKPRNLEMSNRYSDWWIRAEKVSRLFLKTLKTIETLNNMNAVSFYSLLSSSDLSLILRSKPCRSLHYHFFYTCCLFLVTDFDWNLWEKEFFLFGRSEMKKKSKRITFDAWRPFS